MDPLRWVLSDILLFLILAPTGCRDQDPSEQPQSAPLFADMLHAFLDNLIKNHWLPGRWTSR